jgi:lantibiotic modifying enzyme
VGAGRRPIEVRSPVDRARFWGVQNQDPSDVFQPVTFWTPLAEDGTPVFERILIPFGDQVWSAVCGAVPGAATLIRREDVVRDTVLRTSSILSDPIYRRFLALAEAHSLASRSFDYGKFEALLLGGGLRTILERRPSLDSLIDRILNSAVDTWVEFISALETDQTTLARHGLIRPHTDVIDAATPGAGDYHDRGRSAIKVEFAGGQVVYFKPRSGQADQIWNRLLVEVGDALGIHLPTTLLVDCGSHHWVRAVESSRSQESVEYFYRQLGVLTFLTSLLQGVDFHCENLIATKDGPVIVDLEGLLHPVELAPSHLDSATAEAFSRLAVSVINTGLLPCSFGRDERSASVGAMNPPIEVIARRVVVTNARTAEMKFDWGEVSASWSDHTPLSDHSTFEDSWIQAVLEGFRLGYRACEGKRFEEPLLRAVEAFGAAELRFIARPTAYYFNALHEMLAATYAIPALDEREVLARYLRSLPDFYGLGDRLVELEVEALLRFDVPRFVRSGSELVANLAGGGELQLVRPTTPSHDAMRKCSGLSAADLELQESFVAGSFGWLRTARSTISEPYQSVTNAELLDLSVELGRDVRRRDCMDCDESSCDAVAEQF